MRRSLTFLMALSTALLCPVIVLGGFGQQDRLEGRWEGTVQSPAGESKAVAVFKKTGDVYSGTMSRLRGDGDFPLGEVKLTGYRVTFSPHIESGQGVFDMKFNLTLQGDSLKGTGEVNYSGQTFELTYDLKRVAAGSDSSAPAAPPARQQSDAQTQPARRPLVPQPQQKQSIDYFTGVWNYKWMGRESLLGPGGNVEATATYSPIPDSKFVEGRIEGKVDGVAFRVPVTMGFDDDTKVLVVSERLPSGQLMLSMGDWRSPIAIRFQIAPLKIDNHVIRLKRTIAVISAFSFSLTEELSVDGGPFERLGQGMFTKVTSAAAGAPQK